MRFSINQAAKAVGVARSTLYRDIKEGKVSVGKDGKGKPFIDVCELERVYGKVTVSDMSEDVPIGHVATVEKDSKDSVLQREIELLRERLADKDSVIDDLRRRLDSEAEERRRLTMLLTYQPEPPQPDTTKTAHGKGRLWEKLFGDSKK